MCDIVGLESVIRRRTEPGNAIVPLDSVLRLDEATRSDVGKRRILLNLEVAIPIGDGEDLKVVAVRVQPVEPSATVVVVDALVLVERVGPVGQASGTDPLPDGVEVGFGDKEGVVLRLESVGAAWSSAKSRDVSPTWTTLNGPY